MYYQTLDENNITPILKEKAVISNENFFQEKYYIIY